MHVVIIVGNPRTGSRTRHAAELVAQRLASGSTVDVIEVAELGSGLLSWGDPAVAEAKERVGRADMLVVASPTYKGTYTGLLKLFLDQFAAGELGDVPTVALMLGGAQNHALAVEYTLKPVLVEIGCSCPAPGLYLLDSDYETPVALDEWFERARSVFSRLS
jgi:FMN reductase